MFNKIKNQKGFTLMEMLIVVAIIAILVAIAIPTFNNSLNKARVATDAANLRAAYAEVMVNYLEDPDGSVASVDVKLTGDNTAGQVIAGSGDNSTYTWKKDTTTKVSIDTKTGVVSFGEGVTLKTK